MDQRVELVSIVVFIGTSDFSCRHSYGFTIGHSQMSLALLETEALIPEQLRKVANISLFPLLGICDDAFWKIVVKQTAWYICRGVATLRPDASSRFIAVKEYCLPLKRVSLEARPLLLARTGDLGDITGVFPRSQIYPRTERKTHQHVTTCKNGIGLLVSEVSKAPSLATSRSSSARC